MKSSVKHEYFCFAGHAAPRYPYRDPISGRTTSSRQPPRCRRRCGSQSVSSTSIKSGSSEQVSLSYVFACDARAQD
jgi:hypothetical protein